MAPKDPAPCTTNDEILAQVRDEIRGLRAELAADREQRQAPAKPKATTKKAAAKKGTTTVDGR